METRLEYEGKKIAVKLKVLTPALRKNINHLLINRRKKYYESAYDEVEELSYSGDSASVLASLNADTSESLAVMRNRLEENHRNEFNIIVAREVIIEHASNKMFNEMLQTDFDSDFWQNQSEEVLQQIADYFHFRNQTPR